MSRRFTTAEDKCITAMMEMGFSRDKSLTMLIANGWTVESAMASFVAGDVVQPSSVAGDVVQPSSVAGDVVQPSSVAGVAAPGVPLCRCGRLLSQPACCILCPGQHTRTCRARQKQLAEPSAPAQTVTGDCPVCLEPVSLMPLSCGHGVCHECAVLMGLASHQHCPLCRAPIDGRLPSKGAGKRARTPTTPLGATGAASSSEAGYVLLKTPDYMKHLLGYHPVSWPSLEGRLGHAPGTLAGRLADLHLCLRGVKGRKEAAFLWRSIHDTGEMPVHS